MCIVFVFFKQKTAYEMRISYWSSDVCSSDLVAHQHHVDPVARQGVAADARDVGDLDRVGAVAIGDLDGDRWPRARTGELGRQQQDRKSVVLGKECVSTGRFRWSPCH